MPAVLDDFAWLAERTGEKMSQASAFKWSMMASFMALAAIGFSTMNCFGRGNKVEPRDPYEVSVEAEMWKSPVLKVCKTSILEFYEKNRSWPKSVNDIIPPEGVVARYGKSRSISISRSNLKIEYKGVDKDRDRGYSIEINGWQTDLVVEEDVK